MSHPTPSFGTRGRPIEAFGNRIFGAALKVPVSIVISRSPPRAPFFLFFSLLLAFSFLSGQEADWYNMSGAWPKIKGSVSCRAEGGIKDPPSALTLFKLNLYGKYLDSPYEARMEFYAVRRFDTGRPWRVGLAFDVTGANDCYYLLAIGDAHAMRLVLSRADSKVRTDRPLPGNFTITNLAAGSPVKTGYHDRCLIVLRRNRDGIEAVLRNLTSGKKVSTVSTAGPFRKNGRLAMTADNVQCRIPILDLKSGQDGFVTILKGRVHGLRLVKKKPGSGASAVKLPE